MAISPNELALPNNETTIEFTIGYVILGLISQVDLILKGFYTKQMPFKVMFPGYIPVHIVTGVGHAYSEVGWHVHIETDEIASYLVFT